MLDTKTILDGSGIAKQTPEQRAMIDAVMFALWAQGHRERSAIGSAGLVILSGLVRSILNFFYLPVRLLRNMPEIIWQLFLRYLSFMFLKSTL